MVNKTNESIEIKNAQPVSLIWKNKNEELLEILNFWEKYKKLWDKLRDDYWANHYIKLLNIEPENDGEEVIDSFIKLTQRYNKKEKEFLEWLTNEEKEILDSLDWISKEKFIKEYLKDYITYNWEHDEIITSIKPDTIKYDVFYWRNDIDQEEGTIFNFKSSKIDDERAIDIAERIKLKERNKLELSWNNIWVEWAKAIASMDFKEWVSLNLSNNRKIWAEWAKIISEKIKLKESMSLNLSGCNIWDKWIKYICENIEFKEWNSLILRGNWIWSEWAEIISKKLELKNWMILNLDDNSIWDSWIIEMSKNIKLKEWVCLNLNENNISDVWIEKFIENVELKRGVLLWFSDNNISDRWLKIIAEKIELKENVWLFLWWNRITDEWIKEFVKKIELKEWNFLELSYTEIWDEWIQAIIDNLKLKKWVVLILSDNENISEEMKSKAREWIKENNDKWINCQIII